MGSQRVGHDWVTELNWWITLPTNLKTEMKWTNSLKGTICQIYTQKITENLNRFMSISSAGEESACNAGDPGMIPGSGSFPGEGIGYSFQCSWDSLVTQMVKNLLMMPETLARSLDWEGPLKEGMATHCSILVWRIPWTEEPGELQSMGLLRVRHDRATFSSLLHVY